MIECTLRRFPVVLAIIALMLTATASRAALIGNATTARAANADGALGVFYTNFIPVTGPGTVDTFNIYFQGDTNTFEVLQLRPTATPDQYIVAYRSGAIAPSGTSGTVSQIALPGGPVDVLPGDIFAHYGRGIPYSDIAQTQNGNLQLNSVPIFYSVPAGSIPTPGDGQFLTLSTTVGASTLGAFPINMTYKRDYASNVSYTPADRVFFDGNALINRPLNDGVAGGLFTFLNPIEQGGVVTQFSYFDNDAAGRQITPVILEEVAGAFVIRGIGTTRTTDASGVQTFAFDLVSGSSEVAPGYFLAWKDGSVGADNQGVADYTDGGDPFGIRYFGMHTTFAVGDNLGAGQAFNRQYSVEFTLLHTVPEPVTAMMLLIAAPALLRRRRMSR